MNQGVAITHQAVQQGFTLIELSIVLVIIGLLVGGVLVGQDLIRAAEIRATVGQVERLNATVNTFRSKYNGLPGDISATNATAFGFIARAGSPGRGDNNGLIDGNNAGTPTNERFTQESGFFWDDLTRANLIDGVFVSAADGVSVAAIPSTGVNDQFPEAKLGRGNKYHVGSTGGLNYYLITGITDTVVTTGNMNLTGNLTPIELFNMDNKLDDGIPLTGIVQAHGAPGNNATPLTSPPTASMSATVGICLLGTASATDTYNRSLNDGGSTPSCIGRFRFN